MTKHEVNCARCSWQLGWALSSMPGPSVYCTPCIETMEQEEDLERLRENKRVADLYKDNFDALINRSRG